MKKLLAPIWYFVVIIPVFFGVLLPTIMIYGLFEQLYDIRGLEFVLGPILFFTWGTICFWGANKGLAKAESLQNPSILDHFRQSALYYLLLPFVYQAVTPFYGGLAQGYTVIVLATAVWAILLNIIFLVRLHITNRSQTAQITS